MRIFTKNYNKISVEVTMLRPFDVQKKKIKLAHPAQIVVLIGQF